MSQFTNQEKEEKLLYLECYSGISGDMTVGALLDLGASRNVLEETLKSLGVGGYHLHFGRKLKCGIDAYDFDVHLEEEEHGHGHDHDHDHDHNHGHDHDHDHKHDHAMTTITNTTMNTTTNTTTIMTTLTATPISTGISRIFLKS